jgi:hypothetical protein
MQLQMKPFRNAFLGGGNLNPSKTRIFEVSQFIAHLPPGGIGDPKNQQRHYWRELFFGFEKRGRKGTSITFQIERGLHNPCVKKKAGKPRGAFFKAGSSV